MAWSMRATRAGDERAGVAGADPEQRHEEEVGAVPAVDDRLERGVEHGFGGGAAEAGREAGEGGDRVRLAAGGDDGEGLGDAVGEGRRRRGLAAGDLDAEGAGGGEAVGLERDVDVVEAGGDAVGGDEGEAVLAGGEDVGLAQRPRHRALAADGGAQARRA